MERIIQAFITLFVIMDPIGNLPLFISLAKGMPAKEVKKNVDKSIFVAGVLLFIFLFMGIKIFDFFGINLDSFQIAGGIILLIMGTLYVFGISLKYVKSNNADLTVPVGTPLLTGPGAIMTTILLVNENGTLVTVIAAFLTLLATWLIMLNAFRVYKVLGENWTNVISRVMGIILAAIAVDFIIKGVLNIVKQMA
ncbi:MarC family protein [Candidatus Woesearchaeota archaeon]|nr:MarC family protein [Candidatus Woesearchaeota archaeon]